MAEAPSTSNIFGLGSLGQHVRVRRYGVRHALHVYDHHAILSNVEGTRCIHFTSLHWWEPLAVQETDVGVFLHGTDRGDVEVVWQSTDFAPIQVVERARSQIGRHGYQFFGDNCEAFTNWCVTGKATSEQVQLLSTSLHALHQRMATSISNRLQRMSARAIALYPSSRQRDTDPPAATGKLLKQRNIFQL
jgi:hypothetical protein